MSPPKNLSWRLAALGLVVGALAAAGALALVEAAQGDAPAPEPIPPGEGHEAGMEADARCAHMPEHCPAPGGAPA